MSAEILLQRMSELPGVKRATYSPLTPEQETKVGAPGKAITCILGGEVEKYVAMGEKFIARGEIYASDAMIDLPEYHDALVERMTVAIKMFSPKWAGSEITPSANT